MPDPHDALMLFAEVAVALAGFSGIVIAVSRRSWNRLTSLEQRRLSNLFALSGTVLLVALLGMSLLHVADLDEAMLWRRGSTIFAFLGATMLGLDMAKVARLEAAERATMHSGWLAVFNSLAAAALLVQLANGIWFAEAWLFFLGLAGFVGFAFQQFVLAVGMPHGET